MFPSVAQPSVPPDAGFSRLPGLSQPRLTGLLAAALAGGAVTLLAILGATGMVLSPEFAKFVLLAAAVGALAGYCRWRQHPWRLTDTAVITSVATLGLLLCGLVSCTALRLGLPLADGALARGDALLGFDVSRVSDYVAARPTVSSLLHFAYNVSGPVCVAAIGWNVYAGDRARLWQSVGTIIVAMQITAVVSILFPAQGASVSLGLDALQGNGLPHGAGTYSASEFMHFYAGRDPFVALEDMNGIVCFPSFHTVMALVIVQGVANSPLKWVALPWSALTIVSTVPMGGHYVTDLLGGILVWVVACRLATWACRFPDGNRQPASLHSRGGEHHDGALPAG